MVMKIYKNFISEVVKSTIPTDKRTLKNLPRYSTGKPKVHFAEWLGLKGQGSKGYDGRYYGWSHRAIHGFKVGDEISGDHIGHKDYDWNDDENGIKHEPYKIKSEEEAKEHALRFAKNVS
jgi:hypothetical protein